ncbi:MAG: WapI family immunity protein [Methylocella sp.]
MPWDSDWLVVAGEAELDGRAWKFRDPCLLTTEVSALANWLEARSKDASKDSEIGFIEPNLTSRGTKVRCGSNLGLSAALHGRPRIKPEYFISVSRPLRTSWRRPPGRCARTCATTR